MFLQIVATQTSDCEARSLCPSVLLWFAYVHAIDLKLHGFVAEDPGERSVDCWNLDMRHVRYE